MKELPKMERTYMLVVISLLLTHINFAQSTKSLSFDQFISRKTIKVDSLEVAGRINQFLNYEIDKSGPTWFEGNITTSENIQYSDLKMNFNVFSNSLYLLFENNVYRVSNFSIQGFDILQKEGLLKFRKGYAIPFRTIVLAVINDSPQNVFKYLAEFEEWRKLNIKEVRIVDSDPSEVTIELNTGFRGQLNSLKKYLEANDSASKVKLEYTPAELGHEQFMQVLFQHDLFTVLKFHLKKSTVTESVSLVKHESSFMFDDEDYFIADNTKTLHEFLFTKRSITKALAAINIGSSNKVSGIGNEEKVVKWFRNNTFSKQ